MVLYYYSDNAMVPLWLHLRKLQHSVCLVVDNNADQNKQTST
jgi:hypothetical protein